MENSTKHADVARVYEAAVADLRFFIKQAEANRKLGTIEGAKGRLLEMMHLYVDLCSNRQIDDADRLAALNSYHGFTVTAVGVALAKDHSGPKSWMMYRPDTETVQEAYEDEET